MVTGRASTQAARRRSNGPRRLLFERLESRDLLSVGGPSDGDLSGSDGARSGPDSAVVAIRLQATDLCGRPIDSVTVGSHFWLEVYVEDLRTAPEGVFAAYLDVDYDAGLVSTDVADRDEVPFGADYRNGKYGKLEAGLIDDAGAFAGWTQLLGGEHLLFAVPFSANSPGVVDFAGGPAELMGHEVLIYGNDSPVAWEDVRVLGTQVTIHGGSVGAVSQDDNPDVIDAADTGLTCPGTIIAGSGADLASASPLQQPADPYEWTSDGSSWTADGDGTANEASADLFWQVGTETTGDYSWDYSWPEYDLGSIETDGLPTFSITWSETIDDWRDVIYCSTTFSPDALSATGRQEVRGANPKWPAAGGWLTVVLPLPDDVGVSAVSFVDFSQATGFTTETFPNDQPGGIAATWYWSTFVGSGTAGGAAVPVAVADEGRRVSDQPTWSIRRPSVGGKAPTLALESPALDGIAADEWASDADGVLAPFDRVATASPEGGRQP